jgi:hypothetical protein
MRIIKIGRRHFAQGRAVLLESGKDNLTVCFIGLDKHIEVFGAARVGMNADSVRSDHKVFHPVRIEGKD